MPALGAGMDVGRIVAWHVGVGDEVHRGDIVALVETDKANIDVEVFEDGVVEELLVAAGAKVPVGTPLARIGSRAGVVPAEDAEPDVAAEDAEADVAAEVAEADVAPEVAEPAAPVAERVPVGAGVGAAAGVAAGVPVPAAHPNGAVDPHPFVTSPLVRHQAEEAGVDLTRVHGSGPGGLITRHDVELAAARAVEARELAAPQPSGPSGASSSPYARRLATEHGVDLASVTGSGPGGAVLADDVLAAAGTAPSGRSTAESPAPEAPAPAGEDLAVGSERHRDPDEEKRAAKAARKREQEERSLAMRQAIARAMERANREIPHYHLGETVDVEQTLTWLTERNADRPPSERILPAALVLKATALALREYGDLNGYWVDDAFQPGEGIHLGVAINLRRGGLLAPAIRDADQLTLDELMASLRDLVARTRSAGLRGSELTDPTITVSNLGDTGVELIHGVITPPQVALVGVGRITERPWAVDGMLAVRRTLFLSLAGDHRASDGHRGGRFLAAIAANLARPETL
jgi:pyruvate dehydrogenase E2 component (dihydrolipoamide acetyltransferase)